MCADRCRRNDVLTGSVDGHIGFHVELLADGSYDFAVDENIGAVIVGGGDDLTVLDECFHFGGLIERNRVLRSVGARCL